MTGQVVTQAVNADEDREKLSLKLLNYLFLQNKNFSYACTYISGKKSSYKVVIFPLLKDNFLPEHLYQ